LLLFQEMPREVRQEKRSGGGTEGRKGKVWGEESLPKGRGFVDYKKDEGEKMGVW